MVLTTDKGQGEVENSNLKYFAEQLSQDAELIRLRKLLNDLNNQLDTRLKQIYKENNIKNITFQSGIGFSCNEDISHLEHPTAK